jgi:hypothetical protein
VLQLKRNLLHYAIATVTSATIFNQNKKVAKVLFIPFLCLLLHFFGFAFDTKPCSDKAMGTKLDFSSAYHPHTNVQTERVNQIMEDMLRACVLTYGKDWEQSLPYAEFSYNNSYQAS